MAGTITFKKVSMHENVIENITGIMVCQLLKVLSELSLNYCTFELVLENLPQTAGFGFLTNWGLPDR